MQFVNSNRGFNAITRYNMFPLLAFLITTGCSGIHFRSKDGVNHHLIIGIGMISTKEQQGVTVEDAKVLGLMVGKGGLNAGLGQQHIVEINPQLADNVVISVKSAPFSLKVTNFTSYSSNNISSRKNMEQKERMTP